jgi:hypothetical protein
MRTVRRWTLGSWFCLAQSGCGIRATTKTLDEVCQHRGVGKLLSTVHDQFTSTSCILAATGVCNSLLLLIDC